MSGLGAFPIGSTPFGAGTPVVATPPPDDAAELANYIDPRTKDYVIEPDGSYQRMPLIRHRVMMLVSTQLGSAAHEPNVGLRLPDKIDQSFPQRVREAVIAALLPIGDDIRIDRVATEIVGTGRASITVEFTDLTTGNSDTLTI